MVKEQKARLYEASSVTRKNEINHCYVATKGRTLTRKNLGYFMMK